MTTQAKRKFSEFPQLRSITARPRLSEWSKFTIIQSGDDKDVVRIFRASNLFGNGDEPAAGLRVSVENIIGVQNAPTGKRGYRIDRSELDDCARVIRALLQTHGLSSTVLADFRKLSISPQWQRLVDRVSATKGPNDDTGARVETLDGFVEGIVGSTAHLRLTSPEGGLFYGTYPADKLLALGIRERRRFICLVRHTPAGTTIDLRPREERRFSNEETDAIWAKIDRDLGSVAWTDDY